MLNLFKKKPQGNVAKISIDGMHCTSCSMTVDGELEELDGVIAAETSYAKQESIVEYDPQKTNLDKIKKVIKNLGYTVK